MSVIKENAKAGFISGLINSLIFFPSKTFIKTQYYYNYNLIETYNHLIKNNTDNLRLFDGCIYNCTKYSLGKMGEASIYSYIIKYHNDGHKVHKIAFCNTLWKTFLYPLDTLTNIYQVHGNNSKLIIDNRIKNFGIKTFYNGLGISLPLNYTYSTSWFFLFININNILTNDNINKNIRNGISGFTASLVSDIIVNPLRILKTNKQSNINNFSYTYYIKNYTIKNLFSRGIFIRICMNSLYNASYVIMWQSLVN